MIDLLNITFGESISPCQCNWGAIWLCYDWFSWIFCTIHWIVMHDWTKIIRHVVIKKSTFTTSKIGLKLFFVPFTSFWPNFDVIMPISTEKQISNIKNTPKKLWYRAYRWCSCHHPRACITSWSGVDEFSHPSSSRIFCFDVDFPTNDAHDVSFVFSFVSLII